MNHHISNKMHVIITKTSKKEKKKKRKKKKENRKQKTKKNTKPCQFRVYFDMSLEISYFIQTNQMSVIF